MQCFPGLASGQRSCCMLDCKRPQAFILTGLAQSTTGCVLQGPDLSIDGRGVAARDRRLMNQFRFFCCSLKLKRIITLHSAASQLPMKWCNALTLPLVDLEGAGYASIRPVRSSAATRQTRWAFKPNTCFAIRPFAMMTQSTCTRSPKDLVAFPSVKECSMGKVRAGSASCLKRIHVLQNLFLGCAVRQLVLNTLSNCLHS